MQIISGAIRPRFCWKRVISVVTILIFSIICFSGISGKQAAFGSAREDNENRKQDNDGKSLNHKIVLDEVSDNPDPFTLTGHAEVTMTGRFKIEYSDVLASQGEAGEKFIFLIRHNLNITNQATGAKVKEITGETEITPPAKSEKNKKDNYFYANIRQAWDGMNSASQPVTSGIYGYALQGELIRKKIPPQKPEHHKDGKEKDKRNDDGDDKEDVTKIIGISNVLSGAITVITPPVLVSPGDKVVDENVLLTFVVTASSPSGAPLAYSAGNLPTGATFTPASRTFDWIPTYDQANIYPNVTFTVTDSAGFTDSKTITITVNNINRPPVLASPGDKTVNENQLLSFTFSATEKGSEQSERYTILTSFAVTTSLFSVVPGGSQVCKVKIGSSTFLVKASTLNPGTISFCETK